MRSCSGFRDKVLNANLFNSLSEAQAAAHDWIVDYNHYRCHEALGRGPPAQLLPRLSQPEVSASELFT
ncbi:MAG: integrase core domain-containing protein [Hyphomonas sp.]